MATFRATAARCCSASTTRPSRGTPRWGRRAVRAGGAGQRHGPPLSWVESFEPGGVVSERPTIAKIAEQAGVSVPTVSKVLNGRADVAEATRARIESLIQEHGYRRRSPGTAASPMIDLVFNQLGGEWAMELIRGV